MTVQEMKQKKQENVLEVISPSTKLKDYTKKLEKYMNAGVREYWILDPDQQKLLLYFFENENCPMICGLDAPIPVGIYNGELKLDFTHIKKWIEEEKTFPEGKERLH